MEENVKEGAENGQGNDFDPNAFTGNGLVDSVENNTENNNVENNTNNNETNENTSENTDDDFAFSWGDTSNSNVATDDNNNTSTGNDDVNDNIENNDNSENVNNDENQNTNENTDENQNNQIQGISDDQFKAFKEELGLEANSFDEFKDSLKKLEEENQRLRSGGPLTNDKIQSFENFLKLDSTELVKKDLEAQGFSGDKLTETLDTLKDNGLIEIEGTKIRNAINKAIDRERDGLMSASQADIAKQEADRDKSVKQLKSFIDDQNEMFGFKMAKDEESLAKVREEHHKYITSGSFLTEITKDEASLAQSAWLWKHRDTLLKALRSNGLQRGRQEVLDELGNPETDTKGSFTSPGDTGEFNPTKFRAGS